MLENQEGDDEQCQDLAGLAGSGENAGKTFEPKEPDADDNKSAPDGKRAVPIGRPVTEETFSKLKQDAERGTPLRRRNIQQDR